MEKNKQMRQNPVVISTSELWWVCWWWVYHPYCGNSLWNFHGKDLGTTKLEVQKDLL